MGEKVKYFLFGFFFAPTLLIVSYSRVFIVLLLGYISFLILLNGVDINFSYYFIGLTFYLITIPVFFVASWIRRGAEKNKKED